METNRVSRTTLQLVSSDWAHLRSSPVSQRRGDNGSFTCSHPGLHGPAEHSCSKGCWERKQRKGMCRELLTQACICSLKHVGIQTRIFFCCIFPFKYASLINIIHPKQRNETKFCNRFLGHILRCLPFRCGQFWHFNLKKKQQLQSRGFFPILKNMSIQVYKIFTSYIYLYVILLSNRDKIKGYLPKLKIGFFFFHSCFYRKNILMT